MTSVGSGSLMIILLLFLYPRLGANQLVGTDLSQAVPLTLAAALGAIAFGHVEFAVTVSLIIGSVPAVLIGSLLSSSAPDRYIRPVITFVIFASGLKYVGGGDDRTRLDPVRHAAGMRQRVAGAATPVAELLGRAGGHRGPGHGHRLRRRQRARRAGRVARQGTRMGVLARAATQFGGDVCHGVMAFDDSWACRKQTLDEGTCSHRLGYCHIPESET